MRESISDFQAEFRKKFGAHDAPPASTEYSAEPKRDGYEVRGEGLNIVRELIQHDVNDKRARMTELAKSYIPGVSAKADNEFKELENGIARIERELGPLLKKPILH